MKINKNLIDKKVAKWNDKMFKKHPTIYSGLAGIVSYLRLWIIFSYAKIKPEDTVLEIGCESGNLMKYLPYSKSLVGFDISKKALEEAKKNFKLRKKKAVFIHGDVTKKLPFLKGEFSVIICSEVFEHIKDLKKTLRNIYNICTPSTRVIVTVPNEKNRQLIKNFFKKTGLMKIIIPDGETGVSEWHLHNFNKKKLINLSKDLFKIKRIGSILDMHIIAELEKEV